MDKEIFYQAESRKSFDETAVALLKEFDKLGWSVFAVYDLQERLASKGFLHKKLKVIEICNAKYASGFLKSDIRMLVCMPCRVGIYEENEKVKVISFAPSLMAEFLPNINIDDAKIIEDTIKNAISGAVS
ncbi:MAG: DUF302 domain-containing protein [Nanoarchaeota archaeon]